MPNYTFENTKTKKTWTEEMKISERDQFLKDNPDVIQIISTPPAQVSPYSVGRLKTDSGFRNVLSRIKKNNAGNKITTGNISEV